MARRVLVGKQPCRDEPKKRIDGGKRRLGHVDYIRVGERCLTRTVNGTGHTGPSEFCATSITAIML